MFMFVHFNFLRKEKFYSKGKILSDVFFDFWPSCWCPVLHVTPTWHFHTERCKFAWNVSVDDSRMVCRTDVRLRDVYLLKLNTVGPLFSSHFPRSRIFCHYCSQNLYSTATSIKRPRPPLCCCKVIFYLMLFWPLLNNNRKQ